MTPDGFALESSFLIEPGSDEARPIMNDSARTLLRPHRVFTTYLPATRILRFAVTGPMVKRDGYESAKRSATRSGSVHLDVLDNPRDPRLSDWPAVALTAVLLTRDQIRSMSRSGADRLH